MPESSTKNIIMCLSPGRSGTNLLTYLLALADDTRSVHEPEPTFQAVTEAVRASPEETLRFVRDVKLPSILATPEANYAETSHLFGKGPFDAFIALQIPFRLVFLHRPPRDVAKSHWRINAIPARTKKKQQFLLRPDLENVLQLPGWQGMSDYQLCYWYSLEVEHRKRPYAETCKAAGIPVCEIHLHELSDFSRFKALCEDLSLHVSEEKRSAHAAITSEKVNRKAKYWPKLALRPLASQERQVWQALGDEGKRLFREVSERYGWKDTG